MKVFRKLATFLVAAGFAASAFGAATSTTGNIYGTVDDEQGGKLPGVSATVSGCGAPQTTVTDVKGNFHFLNLSPCSYTVKTELAGFATVERSNVTVNVATNTELTISMKVASIATTVTVTSESPLLDTRKANTGATFNYAELKSIPTGRDPWVMVQQVPGVQIDRVNVGGNQSGQQSSFIGMGTDNSQNSFNVDGVNITDMAATGSSSTYYDFDQFQEVQVATGGADPSIAVPGVTLNMVTKRGTNDVHGSGRIFYTPGELQAHNLPQEAKDQGYDNSGNNSVCTVGCKGGGAGIQDYGVEAGGPLYADKAWLWGSYGRKEIPLTQLGGTKDTTLLDDYAAKLSIQPIESNSGTVFYFRGGKSKLGRSAGPTRPAETSVDQTGPTVLWKGEDSQVFGPNLVVQASWNSMSSGFALAPEGGGLTPSTNVYSDAASVYHRSYLNQSFNRPQHQVTANISSFLNTGSLSHELKFGFGYRNAPIQSSSIWPGNQTLGAEKPTSHAACGGTCATATIYRPGIVGLEESYWDVFVGDTITAGSNLTINVGLRYDRQYGHNTASNISGNPLFPDLVQSKSYAGGTEEFHWKNFEPRIGLTYALGSAKTTLLRASYARFADQLGNTIVQWDNPVGGAGTGGSVYQWTDANHNHNVDPGELGAFINDVGGYDHNNPGALGSTNVLDPNLKAPTTDELQFGVDQQLLPNLVAGVTYTHRHRKNLVWSPLIGAPASDYTDSELGPQGYDVYGNPVGTPPVVYGTAASAHGDTFNGGEFVTNRPDYAQNYNGIQLQLTKRLDNRWMAHVSAAWNSWKQSVGSKSKACVDPTNQQVFESFNFGYPGLPLGPSCQDGAQLYQESVGSGNFGNVWIGSKWSVNASGLYQLPLNFNVAANFFARQGYVNPYFVQVDTGNGDGTRPVLVTDPQNTRLKNVYEFDLRIEKIMPLFQKADLTVSMDIFNLFNSGTILQRDSDATPSCDDAGLNCTGTAKTIYEVQAPRALRFGARISF